jgi:hypothetical protein
MHFFGIVFIVSTTLVLLFKREINTDMHVWTESAAPHNRRIDDHSSSIEEHLNVKQTYMLMWRILWLAPIKKLIIILMTVKVSR